MVLTLALTAASGGCTAISLGNSPSKFNVGMKDLRPASEPLVTRVFITPGGEWRPVEAGSQDCDEESFSRRVSRDCEDGRTLIVLIHGFNISGPEACRAYKLARLQVRQLHPAGRFAFLEVYWDGLYGDPMACWPEAMVNSKWTGLGLRALMNELDPRIPVRVLTHSRGAAVICSALWNIPMRGKAGEDRRYEEAQKAIALPLLQDLRIGLLAPALRPVEFESYVPTSPVDRIILGINSDDVALKAGGLSWLAGCSLGHRPDLFEKEVAPILNRGRAVARMVDLSGSEFHSFEDYLLRDEFEGDFLRQLLGERSAEIAGR